MKNRKASVDGLRTPIREGALLAITLLLLIALVVSYLHPEQVFTERLLCSPWCSDVTGMGEISMAGTRW